MEPIADGIPVGQILIDSPAQVAGILPGDIITHFNHNLTPDSDTFRSYLSASSPGNQITVTVQRKTQQLNYDLVLGENPNDNTKPFIGIGQLPVDLYSVLSQYQKGISFSPRLLIYLSFPTDSSFGIPFSSSMQYFYTSSLGDSYLILSNLFFWIWFIN